MYFLEKMLVLFREEEGHQHHHHHHHHNDHQRTTLAVIPEESTSKTAGKLSDIEQLPREDKQLNNETLTDEKTNVSHIIFMVVLGKYYFSFCN
jgi:hypothetical protein